MSSNPAASASAPRKAERREASQSQPAQPDAGGRKDPRDLDGFGRLKRLEAEFRSNAARAPGKPDPSPTVSLAKRAFDLWSAHRRASKVAAALLALLVVGWMPVRSLLQTTSTEAVVNARLISLRAPIEGNIEPGPAAFSVGTELASGQAILRVVNSRADRARLDDLRRLIDQLEHERGSIVTRIAELNVLYNDLDAQVRAFLEGRRSQLTERVGVARRASCRPQRRTARLRPKRWCASS